VDSHDRELRLIPIVHPTQEGEGALAVPARKGPELEQDDAIPNGSQAQRFPVRCVEPRVDADEFRGAAEDRQSTRSIIVRLRPGVISR
jgi:hypothetical protein